MAEEVYTTLEMDEVSEEEDNEYDVDYRRSMKWDPELGDFVRDSTNKSVECSGQEAYMIWCYKMALTERFACLSYPEELGTEMEDAVYDSDEKTVESMMKRTIKEALMVNPRTISVDNFIFTWNGDVVQCSCDVTGTDMDTFRITV